MNYGTASVNHVQRRTITLRSVSSACRGSLRATTAHQKLRHRRHPYPTPPATNTKTVEARRKSKQRKKEATRGLYSTRGQFPTHRSWGGHHMTENNCRRGTSKLFRFGTANVRFSKGVRRLNLSTSLRNMYNFDYSIMGFTETMASEADYINVNSDGTKDLPLSTGGPSFDTILYGTSCPRINRSQDTQE